MESTLHIMPGIEVPRSELAITAIRASGPGGQHVNKTATGIALRFEIQNSLAFTDEQRQRILAFADRRISRSGTITIKADEFRSQAQNRKEAEARLVALLRDALSEPRTRVATRPSSAQKKRRKDDKAHRSRVKELRKPVQE